MCKSRIHFIEWCMDCSVPDQNYGEKRKEQPSQSLQLTLALNRTHVEPASVSWHMRRGESVYAFFGVAMVYDCCVTHGIRASKSETASNGHRTF